MNVTILSCILLIDILTIAFLEMVQKERTIFDILLTISALYGFNIIGLIIGGVYPSFYIKVAVMTVASLLILKSNLATYAAYLLSSDFKIREEAVNLKHHKQDM